MVGCWALPLLLGMLSSPGFDMDRTRSNMSILLCITSICSTVLPKNWTQIFQIHNELDETTIVETTESTIVILRKRIRSFGKKQSQALLLAETGSKAERVLAPVQITCNQFTPWVRLSWVSRHIYSHFTNRFDPESLLTPGGTQRCLS